MSTATCIICHQCDLLVKLSPMQAGNKALCPRCGYVLTASHHNARDCVIAFSLTALTFLFLANCFPFLSINIQGQEHTVTLLQSISVLVKQNFIALSILIFIPVIVIPVIYLFSAIYICISTKQKYLLPYTKILMKLLVHLQHWNMAEIFLIGILVSFIKIASLADISLGVSFWAYALFILFMTATMLNIDKYRFWQWIKNREKVAAPAISTSGKQILLRCAICESITKSPNNICGCCGTPIRKRIPHSVQKTWALLITAVLLYIPANMLPVMKMRYLGVESSNTILGGVITLWQHGSYPIALIIFVASILVPVGKIIALAWLCYSVQSGNYQFCKQKTRLYRRTELVGRWSMIDVFVVVVLVALIRMGDLMSVYPGWGAVAFAGLVITTILAAMSFDPRLIWDHGTCK